MCYTSEIFPVGRGGIRCNREFVLQINPFSPDQNLINPLRPNIHIQILRTDLNTFPLRIS